jgi:hypothetical protein
MLEEIQTYHAQQGDSYKRICDFLYAEICNKLPDIEHKIWHRHPVWFIEGNPIVGYDKLKSGLRLMFWSGISFEENDLKPGTGKFKDASITYLSVEEINKEDLSRWLEKAIAIQWDYKNIVKRKGILERLK